MPQATLTQAIAVIKAGRRAEGRALLQQIIISDPRNVTALLWMTEVSESKEERHDYLDRILAIDPSNPSALKGLELLKAVDEQPPWMIQSGKPSHTSSENALIPSTPATEITFYVDQQVRVSNSRAIIGGKTYALANVIDHRQSRWLGMGAAQSGYCEPPIGGNA